MSDTFCIHPWRCFSASSYGVAQLCCVASDPLTAEDGSPLMLDRDSFEEIWNSEDMRGIRRDMLAGKQITSCRKCHEQEAAGSLSLRLISNSCWEKGWLNEEGLTREELSRQSIEADFKGPAPRYLQMIVGNHCNLKCRMCNGLNSTRISRDPVHSKWSGTALDLVPGAEPWWQQEKVIQRVLSHPEELEELYLLGGEPLVTREVGIILQHLVDAGAASKIALRVSTNGTTTHAPWLQLTEHFKRLELVVSIDGFGKTYEYIRYPARWENLVRNLEIFRQMPQTTLSASVTVQAYNTLDLVDLFRFLDAAEMPFVTYLLQDPAYLRTAMLPPQARRLAAARLRAYAAEGCRPECRGYVENLVGALGALGEQWDQALVHQFMLFTNDLDQSRGQDFRQTLPELYGLIEEAGLPWSGNTLHLAPREANGTTGELDGAWRTVAATRGGERATEFEGMGLVFRGDLVTVKLGAAGATFACRQDSSREPRELDVFLINGPRRAIYHLDGERLTICHDASANSLERPSTFTCEPGSSVVLQVLEKEKP